MRVYVFETKAGNHHPHDTDGSLHDLQFLVKGFIEPVHLPEFEDQGIILLANEEGLLKGLAPNENLWPYFLVGPVIALGVEGEEFIGLDDGQIEFLRLWVEANK